MNYFFLYYYSIYSNLPDTNFLLDSRARYLMSGHIILAIFGLICWFTVFSHIKVSLSLNKFVYFILFLIFIVSQEYYLSHKRNKTSIQYYKNKQNKEKIDRIRRFIAGFIYIQAILGLYFLSQIKW